MDYLFGYYTGILSGGTVILAVYSAWSANRPWVNPHVILPGIVAGIMWGMGSGERLRERQLVSDTELCLFLCGCSWGVSG